MKAESIYQVPIIMQFKKSKVQHKTREIHSRSGTGRKMLIKVHLLSNPEWKTEIAFIPVKK
jgi:hypothetical protein